MKNKLSRYFSQLFLLLFYLFSASCHKEINGTEWPAGKLNKAAVMKLNGFPEQRSALLETAGISVQQFIVLSTDSAWHLNEAERGKLRMIRNGIPLPAVNTVMEKVIPLQEAASYMNNIYGGTIGGFVSSAADTKALSTLHDIYYGLRLDYPGTKFLPDGGGYAVIRFTSSHTGHLTIPYCIEMGGNNAHSWPGTGGGFTSSTLGDGGYPEYRFDNYYTPDQGSELYEVTPSGNEILRASFQVNRWVTTEPSGKSAELWKNPVRNGTYGVWEGGFYPLINFADGHKQILLNQSEFPDYNGDVYYISTYAMYRNFKMRVWGIDKTHYLLVTNDVKALIELSLDVMERSAYGTIAGIDAVSNLFEERIKLTN